MKRSALALIAFLTMPLITTRATEADERFEKMAKDYVEGMLAAHPEFATELGDHRFDGQLSDYSPAARERQLTRAKQFRDAVKAFSDISKLTGANQVDARILAENIDKEIFELEELKEPDWNPLVYNQSLANSLYLLVARDFDTPEKRIPNLRKRMEAIPQIIEQAKANLQHPPRVHTETAIEQTQGAVSLVREGFSPLLDRAPQMKKISSLCRRKQPKSWTSTNSGYRKICCPVPMGTFGLERKSSARNCASLSPPISRWKKS